MINGGGGGGGAAAGVGADAGAGSCVTLMPICVPERKLFCFFAKSIRLPAKRRATLLSVYVVPARHVLIFK